MFKSNTPTRIALQTKDETISLAILGRTGAEQLLGHGDMLYLPPDSTAPIRIQSAFVDDHEVWAVVNEMKHRGEPNYLVEVLNDSGDNDPACDSSEIDQDELYNSAVAFAIERESLTIASVQRKFRIGYNRATNLLSLMEHYGVTSSCHNGYYKVKALTKKSE